MKLTNRLTHFDYTGKHRYLELRLLEFPVSSNQFQWSRFFPSLFNVKKHHYVELFSSNFRLRRTKFQVPSIYFQWNFTSLPRSQTDIHRSASPSHKGEKFHTRDSCTRSASVTNTPLFVCRL